MRVALIADVHGNLIALEAVLADLASAGVDQIVCLGDVAAGGPHPHEVVVRLRELGCPCVLGNTDAASLRRVRMVSADEEGRRWLEIDAWAAAQLTADDLSFLRTFQPIVTLPLGQEETLLCFHGSPRSNTEGIMATTPEGALARMLAGYDATVLAGGHTHAPFIRRYRRALLINPGSVGLPYEADGRAIRNPPWAEFAIVDRRAGCLGIDLRRVPIDAGSVVQALRRSGMPHAEWLAGGWT